MDYRWGSPCREPHRTTALTGSSEWKEQSKDTESVWRLACYLAWFIGGRAIERNPEWQWWRQWPTRRETASDRQQRGTALREATTLENQSPERLSSGSAVFSSTTTPNEPSSDTASTPVSARCLTCWKSSRFSLRQSSQP
jgi:hypothetical protein